MDENAAIGVEDFGFGNEAYVAAVVDHREVPGSGVIEDFHHLLHGGIDVDLRGRCAHEFLNMHASIEVGAEHDVADIVENHHTEQIAALFRSPQFAGLPLKPAH